MERAMLGFLAAAFLTIGCATKEAFDAKLRTWEGQNINDVIVKLGRPSRTFQMPNGNTIYSFSRSSIDTTPVYRSPTQTTVNVIGNTAYANTTGGQVYGGQVYQIACDVDFIVDPSQTVISTRSEGNGCTARPDAK